MRFKITPTDTPGLHFLEEVHHVRWPRIIDRYYVIFSGSKWQCEARMRAILADEKRAA
jgi:hypothetical protein